MRQLVESYVHRHQQALWLLFHGYVLVGAVATTVYALTKAWRPDLFPPLELLVTVFVLALALKSVFAAALVVELRGLSELWEPRARPLVVRSCVIAIGPILLLALRCGGAILGVESSLLNGVMGALLTGWALDMGNRIRDDVVAVAEAAGRRGGNAIR